MRLPSKWVWVLNRPACSPDLSPIENVWRIMKHKIWSRRPQTVEQLKFPNELMMIYELINIKWKAFANCFTQNPNIFGVGACKRLRMNYIFRKLDLQTKVFIIHLYFKHCFVNRTEKKIVVICVTTHEDTKTHQWWS